jgi:ankyrin repeat protein
MSPRLKHIFIFLTLGLFLLSQEVFSQNDDTIEIDTTDYIPFFYKGALDYNLMIAASKGYASEVSRLISLGADITAATDQGVTALIFAVANNRTEVAKMLIEYGADPNKITLRGDTPLFLAVKNGNDEIAEALIRAGIDVDNTDQNNVTALHYAAAYDYLSLTDMLLYYDASMELKTPDGSTPLIAAVFTGSDDVADLLIQRGANIEATDNEGYTPFLIAAMNGDTLMMDILYKKGANIYATNLSHHNALTLSIISDYRNAVKYLLGIGTKWTDPEYHAVDPYVVAAKYERKEIIGILHENKVQGNLSYSIDQMAVTLSTRFSLHDIYTGMSLAFREPYLNGGFIFGFDTKLWYTRVVTKQAENTYYQYWNKGSVIYAGLFKNFSLTNNAYEGNFELTTTLSAGYRFADELKGTLFVPESKFMIIPAVAIKWTKKDYSFLLGTEYMNTDFYKIGPVWVRLGATYNFYFDKVRAKKKSLKWL